MWPAPALALELGSEPGESTRLPVQPLDREIPTNGCDAVSKPHLQTPSMKGSTSPKISASSKIDPFVGSEEPFWRPKF